MNKDQLGRLTACITAFALVSFSTNGVSAQTPAPPPTCPPGKVSVLPNPVHYTNPYGEFLLFAEYCNATGEAVKQAEAQLRFYNAANEEIETYPRPNLPRSDRIYAPNARWCVGYLLPIEPLNMARVEIDAPTYEIVDHSQAPVTLLDITVNITDRVILGRIRNDHPAGIQGLDMRATLYDSKGRAIGCSEPGINNSNLDAHQSTTFRAGFPGYGKVTDDLYADYSGYHIWADAAKVGNPPIYLPQNLRDFVSAASTTPLPTNTAMPTATSEPMQTSTATTLPSQTATSTSTQTPISTETARPTSSKTPTPTITPSLVPTSKPIQYSYFQTDPNEQTYLLVGEVENITQVAMREMSVNVALWNSNNEMIANVGTMVTQLNAMFPGDKMPFTVTFTEPRSSFAYVRFAFDWDYPLPGATQNPTITATHSYFDGVNNFHVFGNVTNLTGKPCSAVRLAATLYGMTGEPIGMSIGDPGTLDIGDGGPFELIIDKWAGKAERAPVSNFRLQATGSCTTWPN